MPHSPVAFIWILSLGSILLMLLRPRGIAEPWWVGGGALLLVLTRLLPIARAERWRTVERRALGQDTLLVLDRR